ncbi:MAG: YraN family protein [Elainella sp.]
MGSGRASAQGGIGQLAETLVADWLQQQGWVILARRWHCRLGELDLVARQADCLAFVEVKARSRGNWDGDGLLAITAAKREKLILAAQLYLAEFSELAELSCRFDVALVSSRAGTGTTARATPIRLNQPVQVEGYRLTLQQYITGAFE